MPKTLIFQFNIRITFYIFIFNHYFLKEERMIAIICIMLYNNFDLKDHNKIAKFNQH